MRSYPALAEPSQPATNTTSPPRKDEPGRLRGVGLPQLTHHALPHALANRQEANGGTGAVVKWVQMVMQLRGPVDCRRWLPANLRLLLHRKQRAKKRGIIPLDPCYAPLAGGVSNANTYTSVNPRHGFAGRLELYSGGPERRRRRIAIRK